MHNNQSLCYLFRTKHGNKLTNSPPHVKLVQCEKCHSKQEYAESAKQHSWYSYHTYSQVHKVQVQVLTSQFYGLPCPTPSPRIQLCTQILKQGQLTLDDKYIKNSLHLHIKPHKDDHNLSFEHNVSLSQSCRTRVMDLDSRPESGTSTPLKYKCKSSTSKSKSTSTRN